MISGILELVTRAKNLNFLMKKKQILSTGKCPKSLNISYNDDLKSDKESQNANSFCKFVTASSPDNVIFFKLCLECAYDRISILGLFFHLDFFI